MGRNVSEARAGLVWGLRSQAPNSRHSPLPSFIPVSLFDLESRFFAPTHKCWAPARARAVKAGRRSAVALRSFVSRPRLDSPEHGGLARCGRDDDRRGAPRVSSRHNIVFGRSVRTLTMMQSFASAAKLLGGGPILETGVNTMACFG
jgi:hypothetical protein